MCAKVSSSGIFEKCAFLHLFSFKYLGCVPQLVATLLTLGKLIVDNLLILTNELLLKNAMNDDGTFYPVDSEYSPSHELLSRAVDLLVEAQQYAQSLISATVVWNYPRLQNRNANFARSLGSLEVILCLLLWSYYLP